MEIQPPRSLKMDMTVPTKIMMAAGPSNCSQRVLNVLNKPVLGHLHTELLKIMDDVKDGIRYMFQTRNPLTFCVSASGHGGMETVLCNLLEDGDVILIAITGIWGQRAAEMAKRYGADVRELPTHYGSGLTVDEVRDAMIAHNPMAFFVVQGDSSTGIYQPLEEFGELCRKFSCLFIVDTVASLGGVELHADKWQIDAIYTGSQKVLGAPPGLTPISFSAKSIQRMAGRNSKVKCFYFDAMLLGDYWGCFGRPRFYHHTISATLLYGLREALTQVCEQGLESVIKRHQDCSLRLQKGLEDMGLEMFVPNPNYRLPTVNTIKVPEGVEWTRIVTYVLRKYSLEIGGGLGPTVGTVFRIGLMGENATFEKVDFVLKAFKEAIQNTTKFQLKNEKSKI